jgi:hypothetical protein
MDVLPMMKSVISDWLADGRSRSATAAIKAIR